MKLKLSIALIIGLCIAAFFTNPKIEIHQEKSILAYQEIFKKDSVENNKSLLGKISSHIGDIISETAIETYVNHSITVENNYLFSITKQATQEGSKTVGFGIFGNVFIFKDSLNKNLSDYTEGNSIKINL